MPAVGPRVLHVVLQLDPGGTERLVIELVQRLRDRVPSSVCCIDQPGRWASRLTDIGVPVTALSRRPGFQPSLARRLAQVAREARADVLHCHHYSPFVYGRLAALLMPGSRVVFTEHGRLSDAPPSNKRRVATRLLTGGVRHMYAVSHDLRGHLLAEGFPERLGVIWNGIDVGSAPDPVARAYARRLLGADPADIVIGSVGRLDPVKDFGTLVAAFASAAAGDARLRLALIGDGPQRAEVEAAVDAMGVRDRTMVLGHREDVRALLPGLDIYANSSITEGISLTLLEAMASELPVVATRVGGNPEIVLENRTGLLAPARDPAALGALLSCLSSAPGLIAEYGRAGRQRVVGHFTIDRMVDRYAAIYRDASEV